MNIVEIYKDLMDKYPDGAYVSRAEVFNRGVRDGVIVKEVRDYAEAYYGNLWRYTGD